MERSGHCVCGQGARGKGEKSTPRGRRARDGKRGWNEERHKIRDERGDERTEEEEEERKEARTRGCRSRASTITIIYARGTLTLTFNVPLLP